MNRRIIVNGYHHTYYKGLIQKGRDKYGSIRQLAIALGAAPSVMYRWHNNEAPMGEKWVKLLEKLLQDCQS